MQDPSTVARISTFVAASQEQSACAASHSAATGLRSESRCAEGLSPQADEALLSYEAAASGSSRHDYIPVTCGHQVVV
jgi:hypothetical protein